MFHKLQYRFLLYPNTNQLLAFAIFATQKTAQHKSNTKGDDNTLSMVAISDMSPLKNQENRRKMVAAEAKLLYDQIQKTTITPGTNWYLINNKWWVKFNDQKDLLTDDDIVDLPPISNELLVEQHDGDYVLKPNLVEGLNFALIPEDAFEKLNTAYGVKDENRDIIKRRVVSGTVLSKEPFIEIYLRDLKIANFAKRDEVVTIQISHGDSVERIQQKMMEALDLNMTNLNRARFITEESGGRFEQLPPQISNIRLSSLLTSGITIFVDSTGNASLDDPNGNKRNSSYGTRLQSRPGVCGLQNLGNTCFMNSALQCLSNIPDLTAYFLNRNYIAELNTQNPLGTTGELAKAYADLIENMWSGQNSSVRPGKLKLVIGQFAPRFNGYAQQDSQELTAFVLDGLHEDLNRIHKKPYIEEKEDDNRPDAVVAREAWEDYKKRNDSIIVDLMHGQLKSTLICPICEKVSVKFDPFCFLSVPVPAKERQAKSTIVLARPQNQKWAKFAVTHTTKTTVAQAVKAIKENLKLPPETRIVLIPSPSSSGAYIDVLSDDSLLASSPYMNYYQRNFYAFVVSEGPLMIIENKLTSSSIGGSAFYSSDRQAGMCPIVINAPTSLDMDFIMQNVLGSIIDLLFTEQEANAMLNPEKLPHAVEFHYIGKVTPISIDKFTPFEMERTYNTPRLVLKWKPDQNSLFKVVQVDALVDREVSVSGTQKRYFSLLESIDCFTTQEQLDENDTWYCPRCKEHRRAFKKLDLWSLPKFLIIHLKRFQYTRYSREKIDTEIQIPTKDVNLGAVVLDPSHKNTAIFDLIGISNHSGGLGAGHYTAKARNNDVGWCEFNDSYAAKLDHGLPDTFNSREAYLLFYQRRDPPPANPQRKTRSSTSNLLSLSTPATKNNFSGEGTSSQISPSRRRNESHSGYPKRMDID